MVYHASKETMTKPSLKRMYSPALLSTGLPLEIADPEGEREFESHKRMKNLKFIWPTQKANKVTANQAAREVDGKIFGCREVKSL